MSNLADNVFYLSKVFSTMKKYCSKSFKRLWESLQPSVKREKIKSDV